MPWYRVLVETGGRIRQDEDSEWIGAFSTRNIQASFETEAREIAEGLVDSEVIEYAVRFDEPPRSRARDARELESAAAPSAGFTFFDDADGSREAALRLETSVYESCLLYTSPSPRDA